MPFSNMMRLRLWEEMLNSVAFFLVASIRLEDDAVGIALFEQPATNKMLLIGYDARTMLVSSMQPVERAPRYVRFVGDGQVEYWPPKRGQTEWGKVSDAPEEAKEALKYLQDKHGHLCSEFRWVEYLPAEVAS